MKTSRKGITATDRAGWLFSQTSRVIWPMLLMTALASCAASPNNAQITQADAQYSEGEQLQPLPDDLKEALAGAGYTDVHFVTIATGEKIDSFFGEVVDDPVEQKEDFEPGEFVVSGVPYEFDFAEQPIGFRAIVLSSQSPGSENDCRRGGTCRSARSPDS
jgi:hypothetical protein